MKGVIEIKAFMNHLRDNNLVIAPANEFRVDRKALRVALLKKSTASYTEICQSEIWGNITRKRVYQIAVDLATEDEIINPGGTKYSDRKIVMSAVIRIAKIRDTYED